MNKYTEEFLKTPGGKKSSTRLFSYLLLRFFMVYNILLTLVGVIMVLVTALKAVTIDQSLLVGFGTWLFSFDTLLMIGIFIPKYLDKLASHNPEREV
jgi:hypothetical protein